MSYIEVENASVTYNAGSDNQVNALSGVGLRIEAREFVVFFGPSGCGKTTLLNLISGLEKPSGGQVRVGGEDLGSFDAARMARFHCEQIGMVFQAYNLIPSLSVLDNVILPRIFLGDSDRSARRNRARELLEKFGVAAQADKFPAQLSGGQQQRIGIARSLINDQPLILADEPVGNLDSKSAANVLELLRDLNQQEGKTIIMVTHNAEHLAFADHIFYLKDGAITGETFSHQKRGKKLETMEPQAREFELLSRSFSGLSEAQLGVLLTPFKAKVLASYLTNPLDYNQNQRLEEVTAQRLAGELTADRFRLLLDRDYARGGVGLNFATAQNHAFLIEEMLSNVRLLQLDLSSVSSRLGISEQELRAKLIVRHFVKSALSAVSLEQIKIFERIVLERLEGTLDNQAVFHQLDLPQRDMGMGLDARVARKVVRQLEMLLLLKFSQVRPVPEERMPASQRKLNLMAEDLAHIEELIGTNL